MKVLLVSADPATRESAGITLRSLERTTREPVELMSAKDGLDGIKLAWRERPDVVVADEITSRAGAFALAKDLKGAAEPFGGSVVVLLDRSQDEWLARWSGADAWYVKPVNPFELAEEVARLVAARHEEAV